MLKFKEGSKAQIKVNVAAEPFQLAKDYTLTFYLGSIEKAIRDVTQNCGVLIFNFTADELSSFHAGDEDFAKIEVSDDSNGVFQLEFWPFKVTDAEEILLQSEQEITVVVNVAKKVEGGGHHGGDIEIPKTTELLRGDGNGGIVAAPLDDIVTEDSANGVKSSGIWAFVMPKETFVKNEATGLWHRVIAESNEYGTITMNVDQAGDSEDHGKDPQAFNPQTKLWHRMYAVANEDGHITVEIAQEGSEQKAIGE